MNCAKNQNAYKMMNRVSFCNPVDFLFSKATQNPLDIAFIHEDVYYTFEHLAERVRRQAGWLKDNGIKQGSMVALYSDNDLVVLNSMFAIWSLGAVMIPMNITQTQEKLIQIAETVVPDIALCDFDTGLDNLVKYNFIDVLGEAQPISDRVSVQGDERALIMFTSGTSGVPKAVPITFKALGHNCDETAKKLAIVPHDRLLINSPPYYTSAIVHNLTMFSKGGSVVVDRTMLLGNTLFDLVEKYCCTGFGGVPVHFMRIEGCLENSRPPKSLRFIMNSGEHLPTPLLLKIQQTLPDLQIYCVYGLTEVAGRLCILSPHDTLRKAGSVGLPLPGMEISIRDESGRRLPPLQQGEIHVRGVTILKEYLNNQAANKKSIKEYGFATGDIGYLDKDGYLFIEGRADDIIKVGGEKVSLKMIEEAAFNYPVFDEIIAAPIDHKLMGSVPCLYYILKPGRKLKKKEALKFLRKRLPANHIPAFFKEVKQIPRATSGKKIRSFFNTN